MLRAAVAGEGEKKTTRVEKKEEGRKKKRGMEKKKETLL